MTRDTYDKATKALDRTLKLQSIRNKIKQAVPEFEYDAEAKAIGKEILELLEEKIKAAADEFGKL